MIDFCCKHKHANFKLFFLLCGNKLNVFVAASGLCLVVGQDTKVVIFISTDQSRTNNQSTLTLTDESKMKISRISIFKMK